MVVNGNKLFVAYISLIATNNRNRPHFPLYVVKVAYLKIRGLSNCYLSYILAKAHVVGTH